MLTMLHAASPGTKTDGNAAVLCRCSGSHSPDPETIGRTKPLAIAVTTSDSQRILADFTSLYVGPAHGIDKAVLEAVEGGNQRIVVFVYDWNGILNIPTKYQGLVVTFTQFVPPCATWQL
jgi:hypothetical protein